MFKKEAVYIKELCSVALITPDKAETKKKFDKYVPKHQLIYKLSGEVITHFNGKTACIAPGTVYILPKCDNADYRIERTVVGDCIDIFFDTASPIADELFSLDFSSDKEMESLFQSVYKHWLLKSDGYYYRSMAIVYEILYKMASRSQKYLPSSKYKKIEKGIDYIRNHLYDSDIDYYTPSKICGISYTYFKKLFKEKFGFPPVKYVNDMRLERSRELLATDEFSVSEIAKMCGFENTYYFSKKFKEKYQLSPTVYRNANIKKRPSDC